MKKRWISTALCAAMVAGSLAGCGLKSPDATTAAPAATEAPTEAAKAEGDAAEESKTEAADTEAAADTSDKMCIRDRTSTMRTESGWMR